MNGGEAVNQPAAKVNPAANQQLATDINSYRIGIVAEKLAMSAIKEDPQKFFHLCLSLARGIDYGVANNEPPAQASQLAPILKQVCSRKNVFYLQSAIMVLMISVKNACKLGWFCAKDTEELLILADEVGKYFCSSSNINGDVSGIMPALSSVMSRYYPQYKLGHIIASLEVKPGYGTYFVDFHITKDLVISKDERIRLLVAMRNNFETSSCIVNPQLVNILLNGRPVDKRTNVFMDPGPQAPTIVNQLLKYGTNLLQAVGQFSDHYILVVAAMSTLQISDLPAPLDYVQPDTTISGSDSEIIEGASRISINCPVSYKRINVPAKGHLCKHYQCFDLSNYVEINLKRPSWRCPHCNQSVCFTDLRVDRMMVKVLQDVGENVSEVTISADGSWTTSSSNNHKDESHDKTTNRQDGHDADDSSAKSDAPYNLYDLTGEDDEMDTAQRLEVVDKKPVVHDPPGQTVNTNSTLASISRGANELNQHFSSQVTAGPSSVTMLCNPGAGGYNLRSEHSIDGSCSGTPTGNFGIAPVLTDAVSPSLSRQPDNFEGTNYQRNSVNRQSEYGRSIPRNVTRIPSSIQALPVQMPSSSSQQHARPITYENAPIASGSATTLQMPDASNQLAASSVVSNAERQRHPLMSHMNHNHMSSMTLASLQSRLAPQGVGVTTSSYNSWMPQTLSQPPHLMRSSQLPRGHVHQGSATGAGFSNSPSTVQRVQLAPQQSLQMRQYPNPQTQSVRMPTSLPLNVAAPQAVSRTDNLIDIQQSSQMRQYPNPQTQAVRMLTSLPPNVAAPQVVSRIENLIDIQQAEQNWRPTGRMRGALTGQAYSAALSQFMSPGTPSPRTPTPRPSTSAAPPMPHNFQTLMANRTVAQATQMYNRLSSDGLTSKTAVSDSLTSKTAVSQEKGTQGLN